MTGQITGRAFVFGDDIDTDLLAPGKYMGSPLSVLAAHCLEAVDPQFAATVRPGDVVIAGKNFGIGSSREQAVQALLSLGVAGVVAQSFGGIFYRNAINLGLPAMTALDPIAAIAGEAAALDVPAARLTLSHRTVGLKPVPDFLLALMADGGLVPHLKKRFSAQAATHP